MKIEALQLNSTNLLIIVIGLIAALSMDAILPALPELARVYDTTAANAQWLMASFLIGFAIGQLIWGPLSDIYGRLKTLMIGLAIYLFASVVIILSSKFAELVAWRFVQALAVAVVPVTAYALARDLYQGKQRTRLISYISMASSMSPVLAPMIGTYLILASGWQAIFVFLAVSAGTLLCWAFCLSQKLSLRHNPSKAFIKQIFDNYRLVLANRDYRYCLICIVMPFASLFAYISNSAHIYVSMMGTSLTTYAYLFGLNALSLFIGSSVTSYLSHWLKPGQIIAIASVLITLAGLLLLVFSCYEQIRLTELVIVIFIASFATALLMPAAISASLAPFETKAGSASGINGLLRYLVAACLATALGYVLKNGLWTLAILFLCAGISCLTASRLIKS